MAVSSFSDSTRTLRNFLNQIEVNVFYRTILALDFKIQFVFRVLMTWLRSLRLLETKKQRDERAKQELAEGLNGKNGIARWEQDYILNPTYEQFLFDEYLEMG